MKRLLLVSAFIATFLLGYGFSRLIHVADNRPRVTGIGGIFFKAKDPAALRAWYTKYLGIRTNAYGANFEWHQGADSTKKGFTTWTPFKETTKYFQPSDKQFMINYRVEGLDQLLANMRAAGIVPTDSVQKVSYGSFVHIMDPEGNKIELWEPNDVEYAKMGTANTK
ncbi:VOC family protein [Mucilaginibacter corticis]|uniref:VOC family protein n=1 Tax=Mucilaginibacter corticis TaxID=2597670 RepID=A0A556MUB9_9SPHI|nr:VOC family protein [Mucilaginibacter corticis]TSJ43409.1 VOC family protein [Mucilaginibacter corticis]